MKITLKSSANPEVSGERKPRFNKPSAGTPSGRKHESIAYSKFPIKLH